MTLCLLALALLAQAPDAGFKATVAEEALGERVFTALVAPALPGAPGAVRVTLTPPGGAPTPRDYEPGSQSLVGIAADLRTAVDAARPSRVVLTLDTRISLEVGKAALSATQALSAVVELQFAGPTHTRGQPMPEVLQLVKFAPPPPPLSQAQIRAVFQGAYPKVRACYQQQLEANALEGRLLVDVHVVADGAVNDAHVHESQLSAPEVERCVLEVVKGLRFPKLRGAPVVRVSWPFLFKKGEEKPPLPPIRK